MKLMKRLSCFLLAFCMLATTLLIPDVSAQAATVDKTKVHISLESQYSDSVTVNFKKGEYKISGLKSNNKNLITKATYVSSNDSEYATSYGSATISFYAKKAGTYKVSFNVVDKKNKVKSKHTITVYANNDYAIKNVTFNGKYDFYNVTTAKSGKFKVTLNKGYTLKQITMTTYNKNGKEVVKKIKNNQKVTLGTYRSIRENEMSDSYENWYADLLAKTTFTITYKDKYTKGLKTTTYTIYRFPNN